MHPHFNSHPYNHNNQLNINGTNASTPQHVIGSQGNLGPNQMQNRPQFQMGLLNNHQLAAPPFTNPNAFFAAAQFFPFLGGPLQTLNANNSTQLFGHNAVNQPQSMPNGQLNIPNLGQNVNQLLQMQTLNTNNSPQLFGNNAVQQPQSMPNGQLNIPNLGQNVNQILQMQMANCGPQNLGPFMNLQMVPGNGNGIVPQLVDGYGINHLNHNAAVAQGFGSPQTQGNHISFSPGAANSQSNARIVNMDNDGSNGWRKSHNKNFIGNHNNDASQRGIFNKNQYRNRQNAQGSFKLNNENRGKGNKNNWVKNLFSSNPAEAEQIQPGKKSCLVLNYTEQEIQQWREARRKNHPSNANMEKKSKENPIQSELMDEGAKMRRQQLKEILAKQAELGCEVAEIPSSYLSDTELHNDGRQQNSKEFGMRENFGSKFDRKSKFHHRFSNRHKPDNRDPANMQNRSGRFNKKQRLSNGCTSDHRTYNNRREPSLLKKLLSSDIKRDKRHLLQVFRFMVTNSFFENQPEKSLKFPHVIVKEPGDGSEILEKEPQVMTSV